MWLISGWVWLVIGVFGYLYWVVINDDEIIDVDIVLLVIGIILCELFVVCCDGECIFIWK